MTLRDSPLPGYGCTANSEMPPEVRMWTAAIEQALFEARRAKDGIERQRARDFLTARHGGLEQVLQLLGLDPDWWLSRIVPILREQWAAGQHVRPAHDARRSAESYARGSETRARNLCQRRLTA